MPHTTEAARIESMTNVDYLTELLEFSRFGALAQAFVIEAVHRYAAKVAAADPKDLESPGLSGAAWVGVAKEIDTKLVDKYGPYKAQA